MTEEGVKWKKSSFCDTSACVEVCLLPDGSVELRDSKNPDAKPLRFTREGWQEFLGQVEAVGVIDA